MRIYIGIILGKLSLLRRHFLMRPPAIDVDLDDNHNDDSRESPVKPSHQLPPARFANCRSAGRFIEFVISNGIDGKKILFIWHVEAPVLLLKIHKIGYQVFEI